MAEYKVVFHITDLDRWDMVLNNVSNLLADVGADAVEAAVVANGKSVQYYKSSRTDIAVDFEKLEELSQQGVQFIACSNSLEKTHLAEEDLQSFVEIVSAGVSELVRKQHKGYAYIKP